MTNEEKLDLFSKQMDVEEQLRNLALCQDSPYIRLMYHTAKKELEEITRKIND